MNDIDQLETDLWAAADNLRANSDHVDMVDAEKVKDDRRLPFGLPGVNKAKKVSNGNYLWISYFHWSSCRFKTRNSKPPAICCCRD